MSRLLARPGIPLLARGGVVLLYKPWPRIEAGAAAELWTPLTVAAIATGGGPGDVYVSICPLAIDDGFAAAELWGPTVVGDVIAGQ